MKHTREIVMNGVTYRETKGSDPTSFDQVSDAVQGINQHLGKSLSPFSITGGFQVSASWVLFGLIFLGNDPQTSSIIAFCWFMSLFVRFR